jgi:hypothetical protein
VHKSNCRGRHRRDACSIAWRCRFLTARRSHEDAIAANEPDAVRNGPKSKKRPPTASSAPDAIDATPGSEAHPTHRLICAQVDVKVAVGDAVSAGDPMVVRSSA